MKFKIPLWKHQLDAMEKAKYQKNFALFFEMGCLAAHCIIKINRAGKASKISIEDLYRRFNSVELSENMPGWDLTIPSFVRSFNGTRVQLHKIKGVFRSGVKKCIALKISGQPVLYCTGDHRILTDSGWISAQDLCIGQLVAVDVLKKWQKKRILSYKPVESIEDGGLQMTYDIECENPHHNFVANNIVVHNSGKTATSLQMMREKFYDAGRKLRTFIFCPPIVIQNWKREILAHTYLNEFDITLLHGPGKERLELFEKRKGLDGHIFVTNYESLYMKELFAKFMAWNPELIIYDESHKLKSNRSKRTQAAYKLSTLAQHRFLLTGTPVLNSPMDLYGQFLVMDLGKTFGNNFFAFRNTYFFDKNAGMPAQKYFPNWIVKDGALEVISQKLNPVSSRVKKTECLDLPPLVRQVVHIELSDEQRKHYKEVKKHFITYINEKACKAEIALTKALRMQQIVSGYLKLEDGTEIKLNDTPRQVALETLLEEICPANKVLVWACFKENYEQIRDVCTRLKLNYVEVHGDVPEKKKFDNVKKFNEEKDIHVFIGHPASGGIGINLIAASYSIFYSRSFSLEHDLQAESRNHRGGSEIHDKITRIDIVAKDTIDEHIAEALSKKEAISERLLKDVASKL